MFQHWASITILLLTVWLGMPPGEALAQPTAGAPIPQADARRPEGESDLRYWLANLLADHRFTADEAAAATGLTVGEVAAEVERLSIGNESAAPPSPGKIKLLPYPGGRHPRIGFLDGAVRPQRETKVSVFAPWDERGYVVVDVPEAIWSQHGLLYLAHTHVPTLWTEQHIELEKLEWRRFDDRHLEIERRLPNDVAFGASVWPETDGVRMECWLRNGGAETLTGLRVQMCAMLKGMHGFAEQTNDNKLFRGDYACCHDGQRRRWVIMAWSPNQRTWGNAPCPCLHSDPQFADCPAGQTVRAAGRLWFHQGDDIDGFLADLEAAAWRDLPRPADVPPE